jgi:hypothetical protein
MKFLGRIQEILGTIHEILRDNPGNSQGQSMKFLGTIQEILRDDPGNS